MDAAGRGDYSREEGTATVRCKVTVAVFGDLFPEPEDRAHGQGLDGGGPLPLLGNAIIRYWY